MAKGLDLSQFKKTASDGKTATLVHPKGHTITVALGVLTPKMRKQMEDLPLHKMDGGKVQHYYMGEQVEPNETEDTGASFRHPFGNPAAPDDAQPTIADYVPDAIKKPVQEVLEEDRAKELADAAAQAPTPAPTGQDVAKPALPPGYQPGGGQQGLAPSGMNDYFSNLRSGYDLQSRAIDEQKHATQGLGNSLAEISGNQVGADQQQMDISQAANAAINKERENWIHDIKAGHINPNRYMESQDTPQKVMTALGVVLGGGFGGVLGTNGAAYDYLQKQIDRDIAAQDRNLKSDEGLLQNNLEHFKNQQLAQQFRRVQMNDLYAHMIDTAKAQNLTPQAQATADQLKGQLMQQNAMILSQAGAGMTGGPEQMLQFMRMTSPERAKEMESRYVPGVGFSSVPLEHQDREDILSMQNLDRAANSMYKWASEHSGSLSPSDINKGASMAAELQSMYRNAIKGGVFKKGEQEYIDQVIDSDPTKFLNKIRVLPKLQAVIESNRSKYAAKLHSVGFPVPQQQTAQGTAPRFKPTPQRR